MSAKPPFVVGQLVRLSDFGYSELRLDSKEAFEASKKMTITGIKTLVTATIQSGMFT